MLFDNITQGQKIALLFLHIGLGIVLFSTPSFMNFWFWGIFSFGVLNLFVKKNKNDVAGFLMGYMVGMEVMIRMSKADVPWEMVKYSCMILTLLALSLEEKKAERPHAITFYLALLIPSLMLVEFEGFDEARKQISFNLSGPLSLVFTTYYFYKRSYSVKQLSNFIYFTVLPILSTAVLILLKTPDFSEIKFQDAANFQLSGGYGPNQVSSIMGLGLVLMMLGYFLNVTVSVNKYVDILLAVVFFYFCLVTFSRGGVLTSIISIILGMIVWIVYSKSQRKVGFVFFAVTVLIILSGLFIYFDNITGQALSKRYAGTLQERGEVNENFGSGLSGREDIIQEDIEIFYKYPLMGVGPGMSSRVRQRLYDDGKPAHTEFSRLLSEHGILGFLAILFLLFFPILKIVQNKFLYAKIMIIMLASYGVFSSFHSAMRLGMMGFSFGVCFIKLVEKRDDTADPESDYREKSLMWQQFERNLR